jgi:Aerobic-type carbon monoxide dehydrogenase, middle subunit CoxM/CutM homologs
MKPVAYQLIRQLDLPGVIAGLQTDESCKVIAGGQSLGAMLNLRLARPSTLIDLDGIADLRRAELSGSDLVLGAMVTHARIEDGEVPDVTAGMLPRVARGIAYRAVRNRGTVGGSLCHADPAADWASALAAAGAFCELQGPQGTRAVPAARFMVSAFEPDLQPGEILARIRVPAFGAGARWTYRKHCRKTGEFALAIVAGLRDPARGVERIVFGALDGPPCVIERVGLYDGLAQEAGRLALLDEAGLAGAPRRALHADLLAAAAADMGVRT